MNNLKKAAAIFLIKDGKVLAVSRKNDPNDFGLPGGKAEPGESFEEAAIRELYEETGIKTTDLNSIFYRVDNEFICITYSTNNWVGEAVSKEEGAVVAWVEPEVLTKGSFGEYNTNLLRHLKIIK